MRINFQNYLKNWEFVEFKDYIAITKTLVIAQGNKLQNILFILGGGYMFKPIECWVCGNDMNYIYDKETEEMGYYRFDCTKCDESVLCPKKAPFLEKECEE